MSSERELVRAFEWKVVAALDEAQLWLAQHPSPAAAYMSGQVQWALSKARRGFVCAETATIIADARRLMAGEPA